MPTIELPNTDIETCLTKLREGAIAEEDQSFFALPDGKLVVKISEPHFKYYFRSSKVSLVLVGQILPSEHGVVISYYTRFQNGILICYSVMFIGSLLTGGLIAAVWTAMLVTFMLTLMHGLNKPYKQQLENKLKLLNRPLIEVNIESRIL